VKSRTSGSRTIEIGGSASHNLESSPLESGAVIPRRVQQPPEGSNSQPTLSLPLPFEGCDERGISVADHLSRSGHAASRSTPARPRPSKVWRRGRVAGSSAESSPQERRAALSDSLQLEIFLPSGGPAFPAARAAWAAVEGQRRRSGKRLQSRHDLQAAFEEAPLVRSSDGDGAAVDGLETSLFDAVFLLGGVLLFVSLTWLAV